MNINPNLKNFLEENKIDVKGGVTYLLSLYFNTEPQFIPEVLKKKISMLKIVERKPLKEKLSWNIPLFEHQVQALDWVIKEYLPLFKPFGKHRLYKRECTERMGKLMFEFPRLTKDLALKATTEYIKMCVSENRRPQFVTNPHYFIIKGTGTERTSPILSYADKITEEEKEKNNIVRNSSSNTIL